MARYTTTVQTKWDQETAYGYLAEFSNVSDWDPSIPEARNLTADPLAVGAEFEVEVENFGRRTKMLYKTIEADPPGKVVLRSETGVLVSVDTLKFEKLPGGGTAVTYDADLTLKGPAKLADPLLQLMFNRLGDKARDGLAERLSQPAPAHREAAAKT
jgi:hypothetical protein